MEDNEQQIVPVNKKHPGLTPFTSETARAAALKGAEKRRAKAAEGMAEAVEEIVNNLGDGKKKVSFKGQPIEAWKHVIKRATEAYFESSNIRGMSEMGSFIGKQTGMIQEPTKETISVGENGLLDLDAANIILQVNNYYRNDYKNELDNVDVIDAELNDLIDSPGTA